MNREFSREYRTSFFFPIALITVGVVWLLVNNGTIAMVNVYRLAPYWPVLLILAGLSIVLNRLWWPLSSLLWLAAGAAVVWFLIFPPAFLPSTFVPDQRLETYVEKLGEAQSASVTLDLSLNPTRVYSLQDSADLINASIYHNGGTNFSVSGAQQKTVRLEDHFNISPWNIGWQALSGQKLQSWEIGLTPNIPLDLTVDTGTGETQLDLARLRLSALSLDGGTGSLQVDLPQSSGHFKITLDMATGNVTLYSPEGATYDLTTDGGTGNLVIDLDEASGVQVKVVDSGLGNLRIADNFKKVREGDDAKEGTWQNEAYSTSSVPIRIELDLGTGNVEIR